MELLAPAGDWPSLRTAINAGCDSVYLGVAEFNMRATAAKNFTLEDLPEISRLVHQNNVKVFVTVNTIMYNEDLEIMRTVIDACKKNDIDAVIVADMAALLYAREKEISAQISTQVSISNTESLKFYSKYADRVVLARELSLEQIREIKNDIEKYKIKGPGGKLVELEIFGHGALCTAVSGRCWMSLYDRGTSANKGKCSQVCRRPFVLKDKHEEREFKIDSNYIMSSADLCTVGMLPELIKAGGDVLKIEGRGRPPEYVNTVITVYKEALKAVENGEYTDEKIAKWRDRLNSVFNRGQSEGLYRGIKFAEWAGIEKREKVKKKLEVGVVQNYYSDIGVAQILIRSGYKIKEGNKYLIIGNKTGLVKGEVKDMLKNDKPIEVAEQKDIITMKVPKKVRRNDIFYKYE